MMIKEGGRIMKRSGEKILGTLRLVGEGAIWALDMMFLPRTGAGAEEAGEGVRSLPHFKAVLGDSPLDNVGPVPEELRRDPFPGGSVPWSIQEAEKEKNQARKTMIWEIAVVVSWSVTVIAALRALGML